MLHHTHRQVLKLYWFFLYMSYLFQELLLDYLNCELRGMLFLSEDDEPAISVSDAENGYVVAEVRSFSAQIMVSVKHFS